MDHEYIETLIPHREPFMFVDKIITATREEITAVKTFDSNDTYLGASFPGHQFVPGMILVESMAQCGGAAVRIMGIAEGLFGLVSMENVEFFKGVPFDTQVNYVISNIRLSEKIVKQSGIAYVDDIPVAKATWMCVKLGS